MLGFSLVLIKRVTTLTQRRICWESISTQLLLVFADYKQTNAFLWTSSKLLRKEPCNVRTASRPTNWPDSHTFQSVFVPGWMGWFGMREHCFVGWTRDGARFSRIPCWKIQYEVHS